MEVQTTRFSNVKMTNYINGILTPKNVDEYLPMYKNIWISYSTPLLIYGRKEEKYSQSW